MFEDGCECHYCCFGFVWVMCVFCRWERVVEQLVGSGLWGWVGGSAAVGSTVSCRRRRPGIFMGHGMSLGFRVRVRVVRMELELYGALNVCVLAPPKIELPPHSYHTALSFTISHTLTNHISSHHAKLYYRRRQTIQVCMLWWSWWFIRHGSLGSIVVGHHRIRGGFEECANRDRNVEKSSQNGLRVSIKQREGRFG